MGVLQRHEVPAPSLRLGLVVEAHQFGHFGGRKTSARLRDMGLWWLGMDKDVDVVVQRCGACLRDAAHRTIHHPARSIPIPAGVFDRVHMDLMLMPESSGGYVQLLLFVDALSKYPIAFPLRSKEASLVAERLWHVICTFGTPVCLHSDNGTEFVNEVVDTLSALHGIQRRTITAFRPQANGQVERVNRTVLDVLRKCCGTFPDRWPDWLDFVMLAIRTATHSSTGQTPFEVMFGRPFNPLADYCALNFTRFTPDPGEVDLLVRRASRIREHARDQAEQAAKSQRVQKDGRSTIKQERMTDGTRVLLRNQHPDSKLSHRFEGPYFVCDETREPKAAGVSANYHLKDEKGVRLRNTFPRDQLFECPALDIKGEWSGRQEDLYDEADVAEAVGDASQIQPGPVPVEEAADAKSWAVDHLVGVDEAEGKVCVRWVGYSETTWEPYENFDREDLEVLLKEFRRAQRPKRGRLARV